VRLHLQRRPGDDVRAVWLLAILIAGAGLYCIETRYEGAIRLAHDNTESLYRRMVANERIVQQAGVLRRLEAQAMRNLRRVSHETSLSVSTAALVATLDSSANLYHTEVTGLEPSQVQSSQAPPKGADDRRLSATEITIRARGEFRNVLRFVEDLSHHATLISVSDTQLALANRENERPEPQLDATIHATLYRLQMPAPNKETRVAAAR